MGVMTERFGSNRVHATGLGLRLLGFFLLLIAMFAAQDYKTALATAGFALIVVAWSILSVTGTSLAARLAPFSQGEAMGLMNAALASAVVTGTLLSGPLVGHFGYVVIPLMGLGGLTISLALATGLPRREDKVSA